MNHSNNQRIAFIRASWHKEIVDRGYAGFCREIERLGASPGSVTVFDVPGAFEIPLRAQQCCMQGEYAAVVGAAFVVDGGIYRHEFVAQAVVDGLMQTQLKTGVPVLSMVLTPKDYQESEPITEFFTSHFDLKGVEAARAVSQILGYESVTTA